MMANQFYEMGHAARLLDMGIGRNKLFKLLRERKILMPNNVPYQRYVDAGYFRVIKEYVKWIDRNNLKTEISDAGIDFLKKVL